MDNRLRVAIAVSQNYYTILDRRKRYARHIDTLNAMKPDIEMTEIPMAPRLVAYRKKTDDYHKSQKKLDDECLAMLRKSYKEKEMARRHQRRPGTTRDWIAELGTVRTGKKQTPTHTYGSKQPQLRPLQSPRSYKTPAAAKIIFPDDNEQITANEIYEPNGLEDGMQVTDQGPASARGQRGNNYVSFGQYQVTPPNQPKSARGSWRSGVKEPSNDSSSRSKRKVLVSQTQTEPESQEYESDALGESENPAVQNKISTLGDTFQSINSTLKKEKENDDSEKESFDNTEDDEKDKEKSDKENESDNDKEKSENESDKDKEKSENNESEKDDNKSDENDDEEKEDKSENNDSEKEEKESDEMKSDFESTAKSDLNSTAKSDLNSTLKSDFDDEDDDDDKSEDKKDDDDDDDDEDKSEDKKDDDDDDDDEDKSEDKKDDDDDDDDEDKSEDKKDDDDDDEEKEETDPFADD